MVNWKSILAGLDSPPPPRPPDEIILDLEVCLESAMERIKSRDEVIAELQSCCFDLREAIAELLSPSR